MPKSIILFEKLSYLTIFLGLASGAINWPLLDKRHGVAAFILTVLIGLGIQIYLIRATIRRTNWTRWAFIALISLGTTIAIADEFLGRTPHNGVVGSAVFYLAYLTGVIAAYFLLTSESWAWFRLSPNQAHDPADIHPQC